MTTNISILVVQWFAYLPFTQQSGVQSPGFPKFCYFFQTLRAKKGHNRHVKPCLLLYIVLHIVQRSFWHRSDRGALRCKNLTFVRENRHFWSYFTSFFNFGSLKNFYSSIKASNHIQQLVLRQKNQKLRIILKCPPNNCAVQV